MANRRFIDFPIASTVGDSDIILIWQSGANKQTTKATFLSGLPENLDELNDVAISGLTNGQILRYDSVTGKWENTDQGNLDLNDLNDVSIVSPSNGQVLVYNSSTSKWENSSGGYVPYTGAVTTVNLGAQTIQAGQFVKAGGTSSQFLKADGSVDSTAYGTGTVTSVALTMPSAFSVANSPITTTGTLAVTGAGNVGQYIRGDGSLADFPQASGGGSSVSYYLNGSISQGTIGGVAYKELNKVPILGAGTDFTINADGYIASFLTDAGDPNLLEIPGGNWNFETYFSASSSGGSPSFYVELYKYDGTTFTLIASSSSSPELIAFGTNLNPYFSTLAVPTTTLALTDRLAIRYYVTHSGRTITLHTENNHLCQVVTTFTTGLTSLNGLTAQVQNLAVGTSGTDFNIASATATHTFNLPTASATNRGALSSADWTTFNNKQNALGYVPVPETRTITINGVSQDLSANRTYNVGTVTAVTASSPLFSSGGTTPNITIQQASGSQSGFLSSTDWTTFNNKQNALTNPVTGTGTTNYLPKFTGSTTIGNSNIQDSGTLISVAVASNFSSSVTALNLDVISASGVGSSAATGLARFITAGTSTAIAVGQSNSSRYTGILANEYIIYNDDFFIRTNGNDPLSIGTNNSTRLRIFGDGNVLIQSGGTFTNAGYKLDVNGTGRFTNTLTPIILRSTNANTMWTEYYYNTSTLSGYVGSGSGLLSGANASDFIVRSEADFVIATGGNNRRLTITSGGNVGIGTASPDVTGFGWKTLTIRGGTTSGEAGVIELQSPSTTGAANLGIIAFLDGTNRNAQISVQRDSSTTTGNMLFYTNAGAGIVERMRIFSNGNVAIGRDTDSGYKLAVRASGSTDTEPLLLCSALSGTVSHYFFSGINSTMNTADANFWVRRNGTTSRSINAAGTINASGADYAEYMLKAIYDNIEKGDIVGVNINGQLTNIFADSISFVVKSTDPSYVGGDTWFNFELPMQNDFKTKEEFDIAYEEFKVQREEARQKVDRIAFSGQIPCNVLNAKVGDYIIPINNKGKISGQAITNPTFEQYQISVGKVWKIMEDGRAWIAVKIG